MNGGDRQKTWLVMGIGNLLMGDEGLGVHVIRHLQKHHPLPNVEYVDGGTGSFHLLSYLTAYPKTVLVDATIDGKPPGTLTVLKPKFSSDYPVTLTAHDIGLKDLLDALYLSGQQPSIFNWIGGAFGLALLIELGLRLTTGRVIVKRAPPRMES